jgi:predicted DNA-binding transcriptional regulator AlpA
MPKSTETANSAGLINTRSVRALCGEISDMTLWRWTRDLDFPMPDLVICRRKFWRRASVDAWLDAQAARGNKTASPPRA